ncbi:HlyD family secretion protein [Acinetobacter rudis]|uniref:HlyD family secretion protein n=1 Tax=Acinetobacter rudis TaxID=632955 RepID=UPI00333E30FD
MTQASSRDQNSTPTADDQPTQSGQTAAVNSTEPDVTTTENSTDQTKKTVSNESNTKTSTSETGAPSASNTSEPRSAKIKKLILLLIVLALFALVAFGLWKSYQPQWVELQGRVEAETVHVSTKLPSRIEEFLVKEGQMVNKGQLLVRLHSPEIEAKKQQSLASLQAAMALQSTAERGSQQENIETLYSNWQSLKAQENLAQTTYQRGAKLYQEGVISRQRRDEMQAAAISAQQMSMAAYQQYARAKRGSTVEQKSTADAQVEIAQAAVNEASALEAETTLRSPVDGQISKTYGKVSEFVGIGVPLLSIIESQHAWVSLNVREDQYAQVYQAKSLEGFVPALNRTINFKIDHIEAEGEFATIKTTRQTGGYDIRSFKLHLSPTQPTAELKSGMSVLFKIKAKV